MKFDKRNLTDNKLELVNSGSLSLFFVGTGSAFTKTLYQTNFLIIKGSDHILIDCGTKLPQALYELGSSVSDIKNYLITHSHADHIGGLEEVMLSSKYISRSRPSIIITKTYKHLLWDLSLRGGCGFNQDEFGKLLRFEDFWDVHNPKRIDVFSREAHEADSGSINLKMFRTMHIPEEDSWDSGFWSCGLIIDNRILFTGDTRFDPGFIIEADNIFNFDVIFHDCQFFTGGVHAGLEEIKTLPDYIKKKTLLVHYGDNFKDKEITVSEYGFAGFAKQWIYYDFTD